MNILKEDLNMETLEKDELNNIEKSFFKEYKEIYDTEQLLVKKYNLKEDQRIGLKLLIYRFIKAKIVNSVCPFYTQTSLDLDRIERVCIKYNLSYSRHKKFTGLPVKIKKDGLHFTAVFFKSGKINCVGLQEDTPEYFEKVEAILKQYELEFADTPIITNATKKIANRVYSVQIPKIIALDHLEFFNQIPVWKQIKYNNQSFPGVICNLHSSKAKILFFQTGSMITTGVTSMICKNNVIKEFLEIMAMYLHLKNTKSKPI